MGVTGAAVATIMGQFVSMCLGQYFLFAKEHAVNVRLARMEGPGQDTIRDIYAVGAPAILMQSITSVMQFGMNIILGKPYGDSSSCNGRLRKTAVVHIHAGIRTQPGRAACDGIQLRCEKQEATHGSLQERCFHSARDHGHRSDTVPDNTASASCDIQLDRQPGDVRHRSACAEDDQLYASCRQHSAS